MTMPGKQILKSLIKQGRPRSGWLQDFGFLHILECEAQSSLHQDGGVIAMDFRELVYFARVVEAGSIGKAAKLIHRSQPAISLAVTKLEEDLGVSLLERKASGVELTVVGSCVYRHAIQIEREFKALKEDVEFLSDPNNGSLRICKGPNVPSNIVVNCINDIRALYPGFKANVVVGLYRDYLEKLRADDIDLILSQLPNEDEASDLVHQPLFTDTFVVICRADHPLSRLDAVSVSDLVEYPWVSGGSFESTIPNWEEIFLKAGVQAPKSVLDTTGPMFVKYVLESGDFLAILPSKLYAEEIEQGRLLQIHLKEFAVKQVQGMTYRKKQNLSPSLTLMMERLIKQSKLVLGSTEFSS